MTAKLKIAHLITGLQVGGAEMMLYKLLSGMDRQRFDNLVVSLVDIGPVGKKIAALNIPIYSLGMQPRRPTARGVSAMLRLLVREQPHILQTWMYHADLLGLISGRLARVSHIVWNVRCSNMELPRMTSWTLKACARLSRQPDAVVVNSEAGRALHESYGYRPRHWAVIPNGFDTERFAPDAAARDSVRAELGLCPDAVLIGLVGRYDPMKDHETFLRAARSLAEHNPKVHFVLVGRDVSASNQRLSRIIAGHEVQQRAHLLGERADIPRLMAALDIATSSSAYGEGFANVIGEAMACGVPCVVSDVGDAAAIVGGTGIVVPPKNPQALAHAWGQLILAGADARGALGRAARERVHRHYSLECIVQRYQNLYLSLRSA